MIPENIMPKRNEALRERCDFELTMDLISGKWKGIIIYHLFKGPMLNVCVANC